ncbi:MAG: PEP-CTERM sorting domain-containing protein [Bryobacterales bacterium]|nr:PEP-CTERM sorting domain-containing protein [Bryobacterales bacterium]
MIGQFQAVDPEVIPSMFKFSPAVAIAAELPSRWSRLAVRFVLLIGVIAASSVSQAAPVLYNMTFTPSTGQAPAGSFRYDDDTSTFSAFIVVHRGFTYDFTSAVNTGGYSFFFGTGCPYPDTAAGVASWLRDPGCTRNYLVEWQPQSPVSLMYLAEGAPRGSDALSELAVTGRIDDEGGTFTVTAEVPEPQTLISMAIGTVLIAVLRKRRSM